MALIYLDNSHLSTLARERAKDATRFDSFLEAWRSRGHVLALSKTHLAETRVHGDAAVREQRYGLFETLAPLRSDIPFRTTKGLEYILTPLHREIVAALMKVMDREFGDPETDRLLTDPLPYRFDAAIDLRYVREFEAKEFGQFADQTRHAVKLATEAHLRPPKTPYRRMKVADLPDEPLSPDRVQADLATLQRAIDDEAAVAAMYPHVSSDVARRMAAESAEKLRRVIRRAGKIGVQRAFAEAMGVPHDPNDTRFLDIATQDAFFAGQCVQVASILGFDKETASKLSQALKATACPGYWLACAVDIEIRKAETEQDDSNAYDLDHVAYYPYVDAFFTDKRIADYVMRIRKRPGAPGRVSSVIEPISIPNTIEAIEQAISNIGGN